MTDTYRLLSEPFDPSMLKSRNKGGAKLTYVPVAEVIARLNVILGTENWSVVESEAWRDERDPNWVVAKVTISAMINGEVTRKTGWGGQEIKMTKDGRILDLGDEYKGATSDALKKAATQLGVGLDLARDEDALLAEEDTLRRIAEESAPKATEIEVNAIKAYKDSLDPESDEFAQFKQWWIDNIRKKMEVGELTMEDADLCIEEFDITVELKKAKESAKNSE